MGVDTKYRYRTPGPGAYDVRTASCQCLKKAPAASFGGSLNKVNRESTGPLKVVGQKKFVPGPCSYAVEADEQARELCDRPQTSIFSKAARDDLSKLFLGKDAVAYIPSRTPGPGTYDLGRKRPCFLSPSCEPGTIIGGPLANVDRVQTGPLGAAYKSYTPGPGAYNSYSSGDEDGENETKPSPPRLRQPGRCTRRRDFCGSMLGTRTGSSVNTAGGSVMSESETDTTRGKVSISLVGDSDSQESSETHLPPGRYGVQVEGDSGYFLGDGSRRSCERSATSRVGAKSPFSLSPFRFVGHEEHDNWQLPFQVRRPATIPAIKRKNRGSVGGARSRSPSRSRSNRNSRKSSSKGSTSRETAFNSSPSLQSNGGHASWQTQSSTARPATTFGQGTRAQAGQILAPGFKGNTTRSVAGNPGPGTYRNFPGSLGHQVDSMLTNSPASSFSQSGRLCVSRDAGVPGPGSYARDSSLGCQVSSTRTTAPMPKFGTSVRCALEDGLVG